MAIDEGIWATTQELEQEIAERKHVEEELRKINTRLELLSETTSQLLLTDNPQGLVQSLCERVMTVLDCHAFFNFLVDEENMCLHLNAFAGVPREVGQSIEHLDYGAAVCGCVARDGVRVIAEDIFKTLDPRTELVRGYGIQAYACHPLLAQGGKVIGTLSFGSRTKTSFADDEISLMKTVADQVATAMERIRLLNTQRRRAEELQAVLDAVPAIVWIAHDPECRMITGSSASYEFLRLAADANASKTAPEGERPTHFKVMKDGEEISLDNLPVQMAAKGNVIRDYELDVVFEDGVVRHLLGDAAPLFDESGCSRGSVAAFVDITERKEAENRERELEAHKREFYKRTILAATEGKLVITEKQDIEQIAGDAIGTWDVKDCATFTLMRDEVLALVFGCGFEESAAYRFLGCVVEAAANATKHADGGLARLCRSSDSLIFVISDAGPGIGALALPDVALTRHYSTAGTLGMGYKLMIKFADRVFLATGPSGTIVGIEMRLNH